MKYVIIPEDVTIVDRRNGNKPVIMKKNPDDEGAPWVLKHEDFVMTNIVDSPTMVKGGGEGLRRARKIEKKFENCQPGDVIGVEDADYRIIRGIIDSIEWAPHFARYATQIASHVEAWENADKQDDAWKKKYDAEQAAKKNGKAEAVEAPPEEAPSATA